MKEFITVQCPGCKGTLEIDVSRQKVVAHKRFLDTENPEKDNGEIFEDVVHRVKARESETEAKFLEAKKNVADNKKRLDALFGEVQKKIEEEKGKPFQKDPTKDIFWD